MNNSDMPAMPLFNNNGSPVHHSSAGMENHGVMAGLTKREMMAMHILSGLFAAPDMKNATPGQLTVASVRYAEMLLLELDRTSK